MSQERLAPQQPEDCLAQSRKSRCKGGTLIAADVWTVEEHRRRLSDPERPYRPAECPKCGGRKLQVHDYRERRPLGLVMVAVLVVARFICVNPKCRATWRVLPALLTRHLWWPWQQIEAVISAAEAVAPASGKESETETAPARTDAAARQVGLATLGVTGAKKENKARAPSLRTRQRWQVRLRASARQLVRLLAMKGGAVLQSVAQIVGLDADRTRLVQCYADAMRLEAGRQLASVGAKMHELERGIRLM